MIKMAYVEWNMPNPDCRQAGDNENPLKLAPGRLNCLVKYCHQLITLALTPFHIIQK
jgi:hypothetical protein